MEDIRIYDFDFNLIHLEPYATSSNWELYYNDIGTWEGHFKRSNAIIDAVMSRPYLVAVQGDKQAIITGRRVKEDLALFGRTPNWLLSRRVIKKFKTSVLSLPSKDSETIARWVVSQAFSDVGNFILGGKINLTVQRDFWRNTTNPVNEVVRDCLALDGAGHRVRFDPTAKKWVFEVYKGIERPLTISAAYNTAYDTEYTEDIQDYFTSGWYERELEDMGEWDASANSPTLTNNNPSNYGKSYRVSTAGTRFGISFKEGDYIVCVDKSGAWSKSPEPATVWDYISGSKVGIYKWDAVLSGSTESEAKSDLAAKKWIKKIQAKVRSLKYGRDYNLGDVVRVQMQAGAWKASYENRIVGVNIWFEQNNLGEQPILEDDINGN